MKIKIKSKLITLLICGTSITLSGCSDKNVYQDYEYEEAKSQFQVEDFSNINDLVVAKEDVLIKELPSKDSKTLGELKENSSLKLISHTDGYYEVLYNDSIAYVRDIYVKEELPLSSSNSEIENTVSSGDIFIGPEITIDNITTVLKPNIIKEPDANYLYMKEDSTIYDSACLDKDIDNISKYELFEIIEEHENAYYVKNDEINGYISKDDVELIMDQKFILVDISSQYVRIYDNNEIVFEYPVVTGNPNKGNATPLGVYAIGNTQYDISSHRNLVGPNNSYSVYVNHMMKFNGNIGFHDYENIVNENGKVTLKRRDISEFGGDTYLKKGSHGCVNMPNEASEKMYEIVKPYVIDEGNKMLVLVKE